MDPVEKLASYHRCVERIGVRWREFQTKRLERLCERERFGLAAERATESIIEDLFTQVLDWSIGDVSTTRSATRTSCSAGSGSSI
jgi:hypothetical protein